MRIYGPAFPTTSDVVVHTAVVPTRITHIWLSNETGTGGTVRVILAGQRIVPDVTVESNTMVLVEGNYDLEVGETVTVRQGTSNTIMMSINAEDRR